MDRRDFLKSSAILAAAPSVPLGLKAQDEKKADKVSVKDKSPLIDSAPVLQNYAEDSMGVAFSVTDKANGYVIYGRQPDLSDGKKVFCGGYRMTDMNDQAMQIRLTGLQPDTQYYYKIGADRIHFGGGYDMKILGNEEDDRIYTFRTAGKLSRGHFCVINDTHARWKLFGAVTDKVAELAPECVVWNGDACNTEETVESQKQIFLRPEIDRKDFAAQIPYLFCPGNHDVRGLANRHLERIWMYRQPEERSPRDWDLGRNFAVRAGDVALIGLDTAEDKQDTNPNFANLYNSSAYREAQVAWLGDTLQRKEIKSAPFIVAFCHIPLFDDNPRANPGDVAPDDTDPKYSANFAAWQRTCSKLWMPLLEKAGCQVVICAHQHHYRYFAATKERPWAQFVGGGTDMSKWDSKEHPTVIEGLVQGKELVIRVHDVMLNKVCDEVHFARR